MFSGYADINVFVASFSSFLFGWALSCLNTVSNHVVLAFQWCGNQHDYKCDAVKQHTSLGLTLLLSGAAVGSLFGGLLMRFGRRTTLAANYLTYVLGGVICFFSVGNYWPGYFYIGRVVVGLAVGLTTVAVPTYISEMTPPAIRGSRGVVHQLMITIGIFVGTVLGLAVSVLPVDPSPEFVMPKWDLRVVQFALGFPAIVGLTGLLAQALYCVDDTPTYHVASNSTAAAARVLQKIYGHDDIEPELRAVVLANEESKAIQESNPGLLAVFKSPNAVSYIWVIIFGCVLSAGQQLSGINFFVTLSYKVFERANVKPEWITTASTLVMAANTLMTFPAMAVDKLGRRTMLLSMVAAETLCILMYPIASFFITGHALSIVCVAAVLGYIMCFAVGYGPILWLYLPEIFPPEIRPLGTSLAAACNWFASIGFVAYCAAVDDTQLNFRIFGGMGVFFTIWIFLFMKETKGCLISPYMPTRKDASFFPAESERAHLL